MVYAFIGAAAVLAASCALVSPVLADGLGVDLKAGTTGLGAEARVPLGGGVTFRLSGGALSFGRTSTFTNQVIDANVRLALSENINVRTAGFTLEKMGVHGFGVVGGLYANANSVHAVSVPTDSTVTINGTTYSQQGAGVIYTDVRWNRVAPYLGLRFSPPALHGAFLELGGYYQGNARVLFSATGAIAANQSKFQPYYDNETRQLRAELAPVQVYPVIAVGIPLLRR